MVFGATNNIAMWDINKNGCLVFNRKKIRFQDFYDIARVKLQIGENFLYLLFIF